MRIRWVGLLEGASFLLLLFVAMPLKYVWGMPLGVRVVGMAHGLLFMLYVWLAVQAVLQRELSTQLGLRLVVASLLPFGPFLMDPQLRQVAAAQD